MLYCLTRLTPMSTDTPYCADTPQRHLVVASNTTVSLTCRVEAEPEEVTFTWRLAPPPVPQARGKGRPAKDPRGGVITGDVGHRIPSLIDLTPGHHLGPGHQRLPRPDPDPWVTPGPRHWGTPGPHPWGNTGEGDLLRHRLDPSSPTRSVVSLTPTAPAQVICYARNRVGRTRVPCTYTLTVVGKWSY